MKSYWQVLVGDKEHFVFENRITNTVFLVTVILMSISMILSFSLMGYSHAIILYTIAVIVESSLYYVSRFKKAYKPAIIVSTVISYGLLASSYFTRSGLDGPTIFAFLLVFQLVITILPKKQHWIWITMNVIIFYALLYTDYSLPGMVTAVYDSTSARFVDIALNYGVSIVFVYLVTISLSNSYKREKALADERALAIANQNAKLEQLLQEKDKLFSIITHDLRSPLNSIQGYLELLQQYELPPEDKAAMESELLGFTKETSEMLFNTLTWAKSQMQGFEVNIQPLNIDEVIDDILTMQTNIASKKHITIHYSPADTLIAYGDKELIRVVIRNVVSNAIKFTPQHGKININLEARDNECMLSVSDTGIGIPPEKQASIFSLNSASTKGTDNEKGIGLGLTICKEFLDMQHGRIWLDREVKTGTTFKIALPLARA